MYAARCSDELWLEVKCLSNQEIAGSLRNIFRYRLSLSVVGVEHWLRVRGETHGVLSNSEYHHVFRGTQYLGAKLQRREGNIPDRQLRSQIHT